VKSELQSETGPSRGAACVKRAPDKFEQSPLEETNMRRGTFILAALLTPLLVFGVGGDDAAAGRKKPSATEVKAGQCNLAFLNCTCTHLIDIGTAIADCEKQCQRTYDRCLRNASKRPRPK
jgi:hypothetical protein